MCDSAGCALSLEDPEFWLTGMFGLGCSDFVTKLLAVLVLYFYWLIVLYLSAKVFESRQSTVTTSVVPREVGRPERERCPADEKAYKLRFCHFRNNHSISASSPSFPGREIPQQQETKTNRMLYASNNVRCIDSSSKVYVVQNMKIAVTGVGK